LSIADLYNEMGQKTLAEPMDISGGRDTPLITDLAPTMIGCDIISANVIL
jgi:hypothetical protein